MKIALIMPDDLSLWQPRRGLIAALVGIGAEVYTVSTSGEYVERIEALGARHISMEMSRFFDPRRDIRYLKALYALCRAHRFDIVHNFTTKPNVFGSIAARLAGIRRVVASVEGLGQAVEGGTGARDRLIAGVLVTLYRIAGCCCDKVRFMNPDDLAIFHSRKIVRRGKCVLIRGEGVDVREYYPGCIDAARASALRSQFRPAGPGRFVTMTARPYWSKGVREFIEASALLAGRFPDVTFLLAGFVDDGPDRVPLEYLKEQESPGFRYLGYWPDLKELYAVSDLVVLPSYAREGVPNTLIEAQAMGVPAVTTDNVGCREAVEHGKDGFLVPPRNSEALADAIATLLEDERKRGEFSRAARFKVEQEFDEQQTFQRIFEELYAIPAAASTFRASYVFPRSAAASSLVTTDQGCSREVIG